MMTGYPDLTAEEYSRKITWLLIIYQKIIKVLQEEKEDLDEKLKGILRRIEATEAIDRMTGEEMDLETQRMSLQERINLCLDAQTTTNNTAVINLFHFWERYWFDVIRAIELKPDATDEDIKKFKYKDFETFAGIKQRIEKYRTVSDSVSLVNNIVNILKHANRRKITVLGVTARSVRNCTLSLISEVSCDDTRDGWLADTIKSGHVGSRFAAGDDALGDFSALDGVELFAPATDPALSPGSGKACRGAFADHRPLEFSESPNHLHHHPTGRSSRIDVLRDGSEACAGVADPLHDVQHVFQGSGETIELPDDKGIALA